MFSISNETKRVKIILLVLLSVFFIINLYAALNYGDLNYLGSFQRWDNDDVKYVRSAWELVDKGTFIYHRVGEPTVFIMPGLTFTVALFVKIFGQFGGITAFRIFQAVLQVFSMYLIFLIGRRIFNNRVAVIACFINLFYISEYYAVTMILTEVIFKFLFLLLVYLCYLAIEEKKLSYYILGGVVWGLACLVRPTVAAFPAVILVMWLIKKYSFKDMVKYTVVTTLVFAIVMAPWWIRNYLVFGQFIPLTLSTGNPFLQGTYINYDETRNYTSIELGKNALETNRIEMQAGLYRLKTYFWQEPLSYLYWYTIGKSKYFWMAPFYWKTMFGISIFKAVVAHYIILIIAILGAIKGFISKNKGFLYLFLTIAFTNLMYLPYYTMSRYSYPLMPIVGIIAASMIYAVLVGLKKLTLKRVR